MASVRKEIKNGNGINEIFANFCETLSKIVDRHAPLTKVIKKERTLVLCFDRWLLILYFLKCYCFLLDNEHFYFSYKFI